MATFYGQVQGQADTVASRRGSNNSGIRTSAQSWDGSVISSMRYEDGALRVSLEVSDDSAFYGRIIFDGTLAELA